LSFSARIPQLIKLPATYLQHVFAGVLYLN